VVGTALNVLAAGATVYLLRSWFGVKGAFSSPQIPALPTLELGFLARIPAARGRCSPGRTTLTYASWLLVGFVAWASRHSVLVRHLKASGEHPEALRVAGGNVTRARILAQVLVLRAVRVGRRAAQPGAVALFTEGMTSGLGLRGAGRGDLLSGQRAAAHRHVGGVRADLGAVRCGWTARCCRPVRPDAALPGGVRRLVVLSRRSRAPETRMLTPTLED